MQGPLFRKDNADLYSMMICFIHIRLINLGFTKIYVCYRTVLCEILAASEYGGALPLCTHVATGYRI